MSGNTSVISTLTDIIVSPRQAIAAIQGNNKWLWLPLILVLASNVLLIGYYYQIVDIDWLVDQMLAMQDEATYEQAKEFMTRDIMMTGGIVGILVVVPIIMLLNATYLYLADKFTGSGNEGFGSWFSLVVWASFPGIIAPIASVVLIATAASNQIDPNDMNFLTVNALITNYPMSHPAATYWSSITPFMFWSIWLVSLGIEKMTSRPPKSALTIAAAPFVVIFGIWGATLL